MLPCVSFVLGNALVRKIVRLVVFTITDLKRYLKRMCTCKYKSRSRVSLFCLSQSKSKSLVISSHFLSPLQHTVPLLGVSNTQMRLRCEIQNSLNVCPARCRCRFKNDECAFIVPETGTCVLWFCQTYGTRN